MVMDTATARGRLSLLPLLRLPLSPDMDTAMDTVTAATDTTATATARGRLSLPLLLRLLPLPATAAMDTTATATERGRLSLPPLLRLLLSPDTETAGMATDTATARGRLLPSPDT